MTTVRWLAGLGLIALVYTAAAVACLLRLGNLAHAPAMRCSRSPYSIARCQFFLPALPTGLPVCLLHAGKDACCSALRGALLTGLPLGLLPGLPLALPLGLPLGLLLAVEHLSMWASAGVRRLECHLSDLLHFMAVGLLPSVQCKCRMTLRASQAAAFDHFNHQSTVAAAVPLIAGRCAGGGQAAALGRADCRVSAAAVRAQRG